MSRIINLKQFFLGFGAGLGDGVLNRRSGLTLLLGDLFIGAGRFACRLPTGSRFIVGRGAGSGIRFVPEKSPAAPGFRARVVGARLVAIRCGILPGYIAGFMRPKPEVGVDALAYRWFLVGKA